MLKLACVVLAFMVAVAPYAAEGAFSCGTVVSEVSPCIGLLKGVALQPSCVQDSSLSLFLLKPLLTIKLLVVAWRDPPQASLRLTLWLALDEHSITG
ncbi:hypothetical protein MKX03_003394 [Papaver bracteatum]|nr:hypothetical protein MKX03_003394 [Papaver bracteatum]